MTTPPELPARQAIPSIADLAAIGDCRTMALVSRFGTIEWLCIPHFSAPSVFATLLDNEDGGSFAVQLEGWVEASQQYIDGSNVLETRLTSRTGVLKLIDFMAMPQGHAPEDWEDHPQSLARILVCLEGEVDLSVRLALRPGYAALQPAIQPLTSPPAPCRQWHIEWMQAQALLQTDLDMAAAEGVLQTQPVHLRAGETRHLLLSFGTAPPSAPPGSDVDQLLKHTVAWWRDWSGQCRYQGPYREEVMRSALTLKLLTYAPTGAVMAAGTTSLPESSSGDRNWDYRYCWLRDTSLVLQAFMELGYIRESEAFLKWLLRAAKQTAPGLRVVYDEEGHTCPPEQTVQGLRGYQGIGPVHIGNDATGQRQLDIYGEVIVTAATFCERGGQLGSSEKQLLSTLAQTVCEIWHLPDAGLWEVRTEPRHNTHSKVMCWVALDRILRLHDSIGLDVDAQRVRHERDAIRSDIEAHGRSLHTGGYVGHYGSDQPDASLLLLPRFGYIPADDPAMIATVRHIRSKLTHQGLLYRYPPGAAYDGVPGEDHLFVICSFWLIDCLSRQGQQAEAKAIFEKLLTLRSPAGLYAEELDSDTLQAVGNLPQAFSHVGLITAALSLHASAHRHQR